MAKSKLDKETVIMQTILNESIELTRKRISLCSISKTRKNKIWTPDREFFIFTGYEKSEHASVAFVSRFEERGMHSIHLYRLETTLR